MTELNPSELRAHAVRCRRLAEATYDQRTRDILERSAEDFDEEAKQREADESGVSDTGGIDI